MFFLRWVLYIVQHLQHKRLYIYTHKTTTRSIVRRSGVNKVRQSRRHYRREMGAAFVRLSEPPTQPLKPWALLGVGSCGRPQTGFERTRRRAPVLRAAFPLPLHSPSCQVRSVNTAGLGRCNRWPVRLVDYRAAPSQLQGWPRSRTRLRTSCKLLLLVLVLVLLLVVVVVVLLLLVVVERQ